MVDLRRQAFDGYAEHPWLHKSYKKLTAEERALAHRFLSENGALTKDEFILRVNRMFLDRPKPKNFTVIQELLTCANARLER
jgi:hypothetical protein